MSIVELLEPILDGGLERNNFFNGRLLSAEDLRAEQNGDRLRQRLLARSVGDGIGWGFGVTVSSSLPPRVKVGAGFAMNRSGDLLRLAADADVALVRTLPAADGDPAQFFARCDKLPTSTSAHALGAYVLAVTPGSGFRETAPVSDPNATQAGRGSCGARFSVEGVRFRLVAVALDALQGLDPELRTRLTSLLPAADDAARERLRNLLAHACFGSAALGPAMTDALSLDRGAPGENGWGLLEAMRRRGDLTDCDVPLCLVVLTAGAIKFVDVWPVRRRLLDAGAISTWQGVAGPRRIAEGEAAFLQFQSQLGIVQGLGPAGTVAASTYFDVLPPGGWLPTDATGFDWQTFLGVHAPPEVTPVDAALLRGILERSWLDEPFALTTSPPVPLRVFQVPEPSTTPFVVFARSSGGAIRVVLSPAPAGSQQVDLTATAVTGSVGRSTRRRGGSVTIPELVPGRHVVTLVAPDFAAVAALEADVVAGRTVDLAVALTPIPNGALVVRPVDASGSSIAASVLSIDVAGGTVVRSGVRQAGGSTWLVSDMPPGTTYTLTGSASGYKVATTTAGPVPLGGQVEVTLLFEKQAPAVDRPSRCIELPSAMLPFQARTRLCMVLTAAEFDQKWFFREKLRMGLANPDSTSLFAVANRRAGERAEGRTALDGGVILYRTPLWNRMRPVKIASPEVGRWLFEWRAWLMKTTGDRTLETAEPQIFVQPEFKPTRDVVVPAVPLAYAVFGPIGVPLSVLAMDRRTRAPFELEDSPLPIGRRFGPSLKDAGIRYLDDLAGSWTEFIADATGDPTELVQYLITEAAEQVETLNAQKAYYEGVSQTSRSAMVEAGYGDDVAIANADLDKLTKLLGSRFLAASTIRKARGIVPEESWSLEHLGLPEHQVSGLRAIGVDSMGTFMAGTTSAAGKAAVGQVLGLGGQSAGARDREIATIANDAVTAIATGSIAAAPAVSLHKWDEADAATVDRLVSAGFWSVEDVASADAGTLATAIGITQVAAIDLIKDAEVKSRSTLTVGLLDSTATVDAVADKSADDIVRDFGVNVGRATAILTGIKVGLARRGAVR